MITNIKEVEQEFNKFLINFCNPSVKLSESSQSFVNLTEAIAKYILLKENVSPPSCAQLTEKKVEQLPDAYLSRKEFCKKYPWISRSPLLYMIKAFPNEDFYRLDGRHVFLHPKKTHEIAKKFSPIYKKRLENLEKNGVIKF